MGRLRAAKVGTNRADDPHSLIDLFFQLCWRMLCDFILQLGKNGINCKAPALLLFLQHNTWYYLGTSVPYHMS